MENSQLAEKTDSIIKLITKWGESICEFFEERNENDFSEFLEKGIKFKIARNDKDFIGLSNNNDTLTIFFSKKKHTPIIYEGNKDLLYLDYLYYIHEYYSSEYKKYEYFDGYLYKKMGSNFDEKIYSKTNKRDLIYYLVEKIKESDSKSSFETLKDITKSIKQTVNDNEVDTFFDAIEKTINNVNKYLNKKNKYIEDNLRDFKTTNLKEQVEIINYYKIILKAIEEGKKAGKKANMSDKAITIYIAKKYLGIEDIEEYYAFIAYAKKCISQEESINARYNFMYVIPNEIADTVKKIRSLTMKR